MRQKQVNAFFTFLYPGRQSGRAIRRKAGRRLPSPSVGSSCQLLGTITAGSLARRSSTTRSSFAIWPPAWTKRRICLKRHGPGQRSSDEPKIRSIGH
jgi:hypothetical protein